MDEQFFIEEEFKVLPDVCIVTAINYWTKERNEYLMMVVYDESNQNHVKTIWVKNGKYNKRMSKLMTKLIEISRQT